MTQPAERPAEPRGVREGREVARGRVRGAERAARTALEEAGGPVAVRTPQGNVHLARVEAGKDGDVEWVEVWTAGDTEAGDPHFRIFNPPTLVPDPAGDVLLPSGTYREDPLAALAYVVAQYGGAEPQRKRRRG